MLRAMAIGVAFAIFILTFASLELFCGYQLQQGRRFHGFHRDARGSKTNKQVLSGLSLLHGIFPAEPSPIKPEQPPSKLREGLPAICDPAAGWGKYHGQFLRIRSATCIAKTGSGDTVYSVRYSIDDKARRITPGEDKKIASEFLVFVGCSYAFGTAVKDDQTLPYYVGQRLPTVRVYNYGFSGAGSQTIAFRLKTVERSEIHEPKGTVVYEFIDDHVPRTLGYMSVVGQWGSGLPNSHFNANGDLIQDASFKTSWPIRTSIYRLLRKSHIVRYFQLQFPSWTSRNDWQFMADVISQIKLISREKLGAERFYLLFYPGSSFSTSLIPYLEERGIDYIDLSHWRLPMLIEEPATVRWDGHPSPYANQFLAKTLVEILYPKKDRILTSPANKSSHLGS